MNPINSYNSAGSLVYTLAVVAAIGIFGLMGTCVHDHSEHIPQKVQIERAEEGNLARKLNGDLAGK